ncbi:MAG: hypothetical protein PWR29_567 [Methanolobus sp.]|jgi:hypothetical protein|nr:hypothetical protein [Methanolobus sp.]MDK2833641.1 hypothetical protein [Methanolobus sp.]MDK2911610.1 hypothetical protein [Methanolobus sp.]MDN5308954.1 hypothetical protein [Methanolobus sp.]
MGLYQAMFVLGADHSILDEIMERVHPDWNEKWRGPKPCRHVLCVQGRLLR